MYDQPNPKTRWRWRPSFGLSVPVSVALLTVLMTGCASLTELEQASRRPPLIGADGNVVAQPMTLPRFLGLDVCARRSVLFGQIVREKAAVVAPVLAPAPLTLPLSHPANADSPSPAVAAAHKVKKAKAAKAAKVKAVALLAGEDCSADPLVEEGLLAALDDASADVRIAALEAVLRSTRGCDVGCGGCCSVAIRAKLSWMVFEKTGPSCWAEPNSKARRLARLALDACGGPAPSLHCDCIDGQDVPYETPPAEIVEQILLMP